MPEVGLIPFPLFLVDHDRFQMLLQAFVDFPKLLQVLNLLCPSRGVTMVMFTSRCRQYARTPPPPYVAPRTLNQSCHRRCCSYVVRTLIADALDMVH